MSTLPISSFGALLKGYRLSAGLTQEELAKRASLSVEAVGALERGTRRVPRKETIELLVGALQLAPAERTQLQAAACGGRTAVAPPVSHRLATTPGTSRLPLVGRAPEVALLTRHLAGEGAPLLLLTGEPGMGKSRLLREAAQQARAHGWAVLEGGCHRRSGQEPYAPLLVALEGRLRHQSRAQARVELEGCYWLVRLLPELAEIMLGSAPSWTLLPEQERRLMFAAVACYLGNVAGPPGTLLVLDDLQWAGADALDLLGFLVRADVAAPLRVVGAYRSTEVRRADPLGMLLADLAASGQVAQQAIGPLAAQDARNLLNTILEAGEDEENDLREQVLARTGGVPFFLVSCAQALQVGALDSAGAGVPWNVAESIRQRIGMLPPAAQEALGVAAIVGRSVPRGLLLRVAEALGQQQSMIEALEATSQARLLVEAGEEAFQVTHDLVREVALAEVSVTRRQFLQRVLLETLERQPEHTAPEVLADHALQSDAPERAIPYLRQAAAQAWARHAHADAEDYYRKLVGQLERAGRQAESAAAREQVGRALSIQARYDQALMELEEARAAYLAIGDLEGQRQALAQIARVHALRGTHEEGLARMLPLLPTLEAGGWSAYLADVQVALAELYFGNYQYQEQLALTEQLAVQAQGAGDQQILARAQYWRSVALSHLGRAEEGAQVAEEAISFAEAAGDLWVCARALNSVAGFHWSQGRFAQCKICLDRAVEAARRLGDPSLIAYIVSNQAGLAFTVGEWAQAAVAYEQAVALVQQMNQPWGAVYSLLGLGQLCLAEGRWEAASAYYAEAMALAERNGNLEALQIGQTALAERDLLEGHPEQAWTRLEPLVSQLGQPAMRVLPLLVSVAWTRLALGDVAEAEALLAQGVGRANIQKHHLALGDMLRIQGLLRLGQQRWEEVQAALEQALALCRALPNPYAEAKALYVYGLLHQAKGDLEPARARLEAALAILNRLGERLYAEQVERALAKGTPL
jgi:predicted ATPase/DNA-binding XRE family transcriptional regulator